MAFMIKQVNNICLIVQFSISHFLAHNLGVKEIIKIPKISKEKGRSSNYLFSNQTQNILNSVVLARKFQLSMRERQIYGKKNTAILRPLEDKDLPLLPKPSSSTKQMIFERRRNK